MPNTCTLSRALFLTLLVLGISACSEDEGGGLEPPSPEQGVGFEILEVQSPTSIRAWVSGEINQEQFDALDLPPNWFKNQPREGDPDDGRFYRSPDGVEPGDYLVQQMFGFNWLHVASG